MHMIGCADGDRIDVLCFLLEHDPEVLVSPRVGERAVRAGCSLVVKVAGCNGIRARLRHRGIGSAAQPTGTNSRDVQFLTGRYKSRADYDAPWNHHEAECSV